MPGTTYASVEELQASWPGRTLTNGETTAAGVLLARASAMLRAYVPDLDARRFRPATAAGWLDPELPRNVVIEMVQAALRNPDGLRTDTVGPFAVGFDLELASGRLEVLPRHVQQLQERPTTTGAGTKSRRRIGQIRVHRGLP